MEYLKGKLTPEVLAKIFALLILILLFLFLLPFKNTLLLTMVFVYLLNTAKSSIYNKIHKKVHVSKKTIGITLIVIIVGLMILFLVIYVPNLLSEFHQIKKYVLDFIKAQSSNKTFNLNLDKIKAIDYKQYLQSSSSSIFIGLKAVEEVTVSLAMAVILSLFCMIEETKLLELDVRLSNSRVSFLYDYYKKLGKMFINSFGVVFKIQIILAFISGLLTFLGLLCMGFPNALAFGFLTFILSLIPIVGKLIAAIPMIIIAFQIGITKVVAVIILLCVVDLLESYVFKPKLMSDGVDIPIVLIFLGLAIGEHYMGIWGLIIGIPLLVFLLNLTDKQKE